MNYHHVIEALGILMCGLIFYSYAYRWFRWSRGSRRIAA